MEVWGLTGREARGGEGGSWRLQITLEEDKYWLVLLAKCVCVRERSAPSISGVLVDQAHKLVGKLQMESNSRGNESVCA